MSSKIKMKLPLLPSERLRLRFGINDEDTGRDDAGELNEVNSEKSGGGEVSRSPGISSGAPEVADKARPAAGDELALPSAEEEKKQQERVRQYQDKSFASHPPLPVSTTSRVLQDVLLSTSQFVNSFVADANARLERSETEISALERQMGLLEGKLASIAVPTSNDAADC